MANRATETPAHLFCEKTLRITEGATSPLSTSVQQSRDALALNWVPYTTGLTLPESVDSQSLALCGGYYRPPTLEALPEDVDTDPDRLFGWAHYYKYDSGGTATLCGDVLLRKAGLEVRSERVKINEQDQTATLAGNVTLTTLESILRGANALVRFEDNSTTLSDATFFLYNQSARGTAAQIITEGTRQTSILQGEYTSCPPGNNDWRLVGHRIDLNHDTGWGTLSHMRLKLGKIPVFYAPYFRFPLNDARHTGFLYPEFNSLSDPDIAVPFYWNIAPNYDLLLKPRKIGGRGILFESELRYLHRPGKGQISLGFLTKDRDFEHQDRKSVRWQHQGSFFENWYWSADAGYLSDKDYLDDFGANLESISESFISRSIELDGNWGNWRAAARLQSYQTIDAAISDQNKPYRKLPEIVIDHATGFWQHRLEWLNSLTYAYLAQPLAYVAPFAHRTHWSSTVSLPLQAAWYFFTPSIKLQSSYYDLAGNALTERGDRHVPTSSLDAGLFFDRPLNFKGYRWTQTLEPRLFHAYTPLRTQDWLPVFDTTALTFGFDQLFRADRFTGIDRIGDTHQTTLAVTTRLINAKHAELAHLTIGQILFHRDREVTLPGEAVLTGTQSPLLLRGESKLPYALNVSGGLTWDSGQNILEDCNLSLSRLSNPGRAWQTGYRYRKATISNDRIEQITLSTRQRLFDFWHLLASVHFDLDNANTLEQLTGLQYEDCCWRLDLVYHRRIRATNDLSETAANKYAILLQFELKGLGGVGSRLEQLLLKHIPGYRR
jgi:LPS-assembly protein